jgi:hypothetical protein
MSNRHRAESLGSEFLNIAGFMIPLIIFAIVWVSRRGEALRYY